jgi:hypothetical protein
LVGSLSWSEGTAHQQAGTKGEIPFNQAVLPPEHQEGMQKIGIWADVKEAERGLAWTRVLNAEQQLMFWSNAGSETSSFSPCTCCL